MRYLRAWLTWSRPRAVAGDKPRGLLMGPRQSGARETRERTDTAMARRKTRTHPSLMRQTRALPESPGEIRAVPAKSGTCAFRRAIPLVRGKGKEMEIRANPRA